MKLPFSNVVNELAMGGGAWRRCVVALLVLACASRAECFAPLFSIQQRLRRPGGFGVCRGRMVAARPHTQVVCAADQENKKSMRDIIEEEAGKAGVGGFEQAGKKQQLSPEQVPLPSLDSLPLSPAGNRWSLALL